MFDPFVGVSNATTFKLASSLPRPVQMFVEVPDDVELVWCSSQTFRGSSGCFQSTVSHHWSEERAPVCLLDDYFVA